MKFEAEKNINEEGDTVTSVSLELDWKDWVVAAFGITLLYLDEIIAFAEGAVK